MLFPLTGLDESKVLVAPGSIFRIRAALPGDEPGATSVEYGSDRLFTNEEVEHLLIRIGRNERFVELNTRGGTPVWLSPDAISMVREALAPDAPGTEITVGGRRQDVTETVAQVEAALR